MRVKRRFSTRWGHPYHLPGACATCRQTRLRPLCFIPSMIPERYMEWPAQSTAEDPTDVVQHHCGHPFLLEAFLFQRPSIRRYASRTMVEHKTPESNMSVTILSCPMPVY